MEEKIEEIVETISQRNLTKEMQYFEKHLDKEGNKKKLPEKKEKGFTYANPSNLKDEIDERMIKVVDGYETEPGSVISKSEIIATSPYVIYLEEKILEEKHILFLYFFDRYNGHIKKTCDKLKISRELFYSWKKKSEVFCRIINDFNQGFLDDTEQCLQNLIENGNAVATIFKLKTQAQDRGYVEKQIIENIEGPKLIGFSFIDVNKNNEEIIDAEIGDNDE